MIFYRFFKHFHKKYSLIAPCISNTFFLISRISKHFLYKKQTGRMPAAVCWHTHRFHSGSALLFQGLGESFLPLRGRKAFCQRFATGTTCCEFCGSAPEAEAAQKDFRNKKDRSFSPA